MNRENIRWIASFAVLVALFYWIDQSAWFQGLVLDKLSLFTASTTTWVLSLLGVPLQQTGATVITLTEPVEIGESCTGSLVFLIFAAAVIPFPTPWKSRLKGLALGLLALLSLNLFRTCLIVFVVSGFPGSLWTFHVVIGQIIVVTGMIGVFLWWAKNSPQHMLLPFLRNNRAIFRFLSLFTIGYLCGYQLYQIFLNSVCGLFVKRLIETHTLWILSSLSELFFQTHLAQFSPHPVRLIEGCLSSPMVVVFVAVVLAWPTQWWKRCTIILLGFVPFFYAYHLIRALLIGITLGIQPKEVNFVYNLYGQILLCFAVFIWVAYSWCSIKRSVSYGRFFLRFLTSALLAAFIGAGVGWLARHILIPFLTEQIAGSDFLSYDPEQTISLTPDLQIFLWVSLVGATPGLKNTKRALLSFLGILATLGVFTTIVAAIEIFHLTPHKGLYQFSVILMPFAVYFFCFLYPLARTNGSQKE